MSIPFPAGTRPETVPLAFAATPGSRGAQCFWLLACGSLLALGLPPASAQNSPTPSPVAEALSAALTFHASFNQGIDADFAKGDPKLHTLTTRTPKMESEPGLHTENRTIRVDDAGVHGGGALRFTHQQSPWLFYHAQDNLPYRTNDWSGSVSLWLKVDPQTELAPGYCDPIQITPRQWNDAAFFVDFDKDGDPRDFRLGAFADLQVWNSKNEDVNDIPENRRPLVAVREPPFSGDAWTHVVFTWQGFNTGRRDARAFLYLNGRRHGPLTGWDQRFTWREDEESRLLIGLNYIGLFDELACFDRALTDKEVGYLLENPSALPSRHAKAPAD